LNTIKTIQKNTEALCLGIFYVAAFTQRTNLSTDWLKASRWIFQNSSIVGIRWLTDKVTNAPNH